MSEDWLVRFVAESNRIEGIAGVLDREVRAHARFLELTRPRVEDLVALVGEVQPGAQLRARDDVPGVRVGDHVAPASGPLVADGVEWILDVASGERVPEEGRSMVLLLGTDRMPAVRPRDPYTCHRAYEWLHPFTDGNGRTGRALWLWMMTREGQGSPSYSKVKVLGFLHCWYYQSLAAMSA